MKQGIYNPTKPECSGLICRPLEDRKSKFVRAPRHRPRVVYAIHTLVPCEGEETHSVVVTSQSSKALVLLGQACLDARGSAHTPCIVAHVEYGFNKFATHPKPANFHSDFSLAEFAAHHHKWKQEITEYTIEEVDK